MDDRILQAVDNTIKFLRMAAIELRRLATRAPDVGDELRHIAEQLDRDADELRSASRSNPQ
ncbi:MAG: hypothetical protein ACM3JG_07010 [Thiohalocapsa sp.]